LLYLPSSFTNSLLTPISDHPTRSHHHAQRRQHRVPSPANVANRDRDGGHSSYCLAVRPPEAKLTGGDNDMASMPNRQAAGHHGWRIGNVASESLGCLNAVRLDHGAAFVIPPIPAAGGVDEDGNARSRGVRQQ
jgi:hypothetical protein